MASQITHIACAQKLYDIHFSGLSKGDFYIGNIFPDIRYLGELTRDETHSYNLTFQDVLDEKNAFRAGIKLHCLLDLAREDFVAQSGVYELFSTTDNKHSVPKLLEDELLYSTVSDWPTVITYLDDILPEEEAFSMPHTRLKLWHTNMQSYFSQPPTKESRLAYSTGIGYPLDRALELTRALDELRKQQKAHDIALAFYEKLEEIVTHYQP